MTEQTMFPGVAVVTGAAGTGKYEFCHDWVTSEIAYTIFGRNGSRHSQSIC